MARNSPPPLIVWVLVGLLALAAMGSIAWGAFIVYTNRQAAVIKPAGMAGYLKRDNLEAAILLRKLAGMPDEQVLSYALTTGKTETAFAITVFGDALSDPERATAFASLAQSYTVAGDPAKATVCYQALVNLAALGAGLHDYQKANLLLQAGDGLRGLGKPLEAEEAFDRVGELARFSPALPAAIRVQLLQTLAGKYADLHRESKALDASHSAQDVSEPSADAPVAVNLPAVVPNWEGDPCVGRSAGPTGGPAWRRLRV